MSADVTCVTCKEVFSSIDLFRDHICGNATKGSDKSTLLSYLQLCIRDEDWHGVWDTAIMLEVLTAKEKANALQK